MAISLDSYFAFNNAAMTVKSQRLEVISANIANASTPNYKARDLDFSGLGPEKPDHGSVIFKTLCSKRSLGAINNIIIINVILIP